MGAKAVCTVPHALLQVGALQRMGIEPIMLSGDQRPTALAMAAAVGIPPEVGLMGGRVGGWSDGGGRWPSL